MSKSYDKLTPMNYLGEMEQKSEGVYSKTSPIGHGNNLQSLTPVSGQHFDQHGTLPLSSYQHVYPYSFMDPSMSGTVPGVPLSAYHQMPGFDPAVYLRYLV